MAKNAQPEYEECKLLVKYMDSIGLKFTHIPNETRTPSFSMKNKNKFMGVRSGFPDYCIIIPKEMIQKEVSENLIVFIEMKAPNGGRLSETQKGRFEALENCPCIVQVCYGYLEAKQLLNTLIAGDYSL